MSTDATDAQSGDAQGADAHQMDAREIIDFIAHAQKSTPVRAWIRERDPEGDPLDLSAGGDGSADTSDLHVFGAGDKVIMGEWDLVRGLLEANADRLADVVVDCDRRNSAVPLLDLRGVNARIEPGALIRDRVTIGDGAVIMMGAVINVGAVVGEGTMIDMGAVLGGRATVGRRCHVGAGAVLAGVVEPASATPVVVEDDVLVGANAVVIEGCRVGAGAVVAAGAVVVEDVRAGTVVAGCPARVIKRKDARTSSKTALVEALRAL
jgi:2,3,4,5-tetrahydropyridine-2-carboxylate N-succinyltransferase/tetrahydrodipicolinate N-acetyltransferase